MLTQEEGGKGGQLSLALEKYRSLQPGLPPYPSRSGSPNLPNSKAVEGPSRASRSQAREREMTALPLPLGLPPCRLLAWPPAPPCISSAWLNYFSWEPCNPCFIGLKSEEV